jgi:hypothetical protein
MVWFLLWLLIGALSYGYVASVDTYQIATDANKKLGTIYLVPSPSIGLVLFSSLTGVLLLGFAIWVAFDHRRFK